MAASARALSYLCQDTQEGPPVVIITVESVARVAASGDMVEGTGIGEAQGASQGKGGSA